MRRLYLIKSKRAYAHRQRKNKENLEKFMNGTYRIPGTFQRTFILDEVVLKIT